MVGHGLSIAKASLLAACLRPDVTKVGRDDVNTFHDKLQLTITRCVPSNVQTLKTWLLEHIIPSAARSAAFGKYLLSVSKNVGEDEALMAGLKTCRLQLHILYILNDLLHHVKHHIQNSSFLANLVQGTIPAIADLFQYPAAARKSRTLKRLHNLLDIWGQEQYYEKQTLEHIRQYLISNKVVPPGAVPGITKPVDSKELAWSLPATHGDSSAPYFDLPAANLMPHIIPNSSTPIRPDQVRALHLSAGPADESLVNAVKDFLKDVEAIDNPYEIFDDEGIDVHMDELGQLSYRNEAGDLLGDTYYGWSRAFCEKMKKRETEEQQAVRNRSPSYSRSRNSSRSPRKRRRYSSSRSRSRSYSRSRSPRRFDRGDAKPGERGRNRSRSFSPKRPALSEHPKPYQNPIQKPPNIPFPLPSVGLEGFPVPPPMPANWQGPWPPPPPPPPPGPSFNGFNHLPFPPPPNLQSHPRDSNQHQFNS